MPVFIIGFLLVAAVLVVRVITIRWNPNDLWRRQEDSLRAQGIVAQRPDDWEAQIKRRRAGFIAVILAFVAITGCWFASILSTYS